MIRKFRTDDLEQVMGLWLATNISAHDFISAKYWHANYALVKKMLPQANIWVYEKIMRFGASLGFKILTSRGSLWLTRHKVKGSEASY